MSTGSASRRGTAIRLHTMLALAATRPQRARPEPRDLAVQR
jgi:hypothetical protein